MAEVLPLFPEARIIRRRIVFGRAFIGLLVERASELTGIPRGDITGPAKHMDACMARFAIIRVARDGEKSLGQIGRALGGRDHTTIHSGFVRACELERKDFDFATLVRLLREVPNV